MPVVSSPSGPRLCVVSSHHDSKSATYRSSRLLFRRFVGSKAFYYTPFQIWREVHPSRVEGVEVLCEASVGVSGAVQRQEHAERAGDGDPEAPCAPPSATVVQDHRGPGRERQRDGLSFSGVYGRRSRGHQANVSYGGAPAFDPRQGRDAATGSAGTPLEFFGYGVRDHDSMQFSQGVQVAERVQINEWSRVEDRRFARCAAYFCQEVPNLSA